MDHRDELATQEHPKAPDADAGSRGRWVLLAFVAALVVMGMVLLVLGDRPGATFSQFLDVTPGMSKDQVVDILGEPGDGGPFEDTVGGRWDDCWYYEVSRSDQPGNGVVCFQVDTVDSITYPV